MKFRVIFVLITGLLLAAACSDKSAFDVDPVKYNIRFYEKKFGDCDTGSIANCVNIKFEYPEIQYAEFTVSKDSVENHVMRFLLSPAVTAAQPNSFEEISDSMIAEFKRIKKDFPEAPIGYSLERTAGISLNQHGVIAVEFREFSFFGGAHPNGMMYYENFSAAAGNRIPLDDLFEADYRDKLNEAGEKAFRKARGLKNEEDLEKSGFWFKENKFVLNDNFLIQRYGLKFLFNNYEVGPYVLGSTEIVIPYEEIKDMIKKNGPLSPFLN